MVRKKIRIGDLLVQNKVISEGQLENALAEQKRSGRKLGRTLIDLGYISEQEMLDFLSRQLDIPHIDLRTYQYKPETVRKLPETHARRFRALALKEEDDAFLVGMADPTDIFAYDELVRLLRKKVRLAVVREADLLQTIDAVYRRTEEITSLAEELDEELGGGEENYDLAAIAQENEETANAPVVKLLQSVFEDAVQVGASDIHIEPDETVLRIRQRVDGVLQEHVMKEKRIAPALVLRLKLMAGLNISERRLPQDGRFNVRVKNRSIDVRLSTMPVQFGESVVMRLLDQSSGLLNLGQLGMPESLMHRFRNAVRHPNGLVLVTGPTGSGKTTTLYAALSELNESEKKVITVEDPVEYRLPRVNQVQVNERIGLNFASVLRSALRQDPDIVMVGEMRDQQTVEIGLRAAVTGHLVLSTLHTNDAVSTAIRLLDMGAESFLLAASLRAIVAQRLIRRICDSCRTQQQLDAQTLSWVRGMLGEPDSTPAFYRGRGCPQCGNTGYRGRIGVYELLELDEPMSDALRRNDQAAFVVAARSSRTFTPLARGALEDAVAGVTTLEEVFRIAGEIEDEPVARLSEAQTEAALAEGDDEAGAS